MAQIMYKKHDWDATLSTSVQYVHIIIVWENWLYFIFYLAHGTSLTEVSDESLCGLRLKMAMRIGLFNIKLYFFVDR